MVELPDGREVEYYRAEGGLVCVRCGKEYWRHAIDHDVLAASAPGCEFVLRVLCNGDRVKL